MRVSFHSNLKMPHPTRAEAELKDKSDVLSKHEYDESKMLGRIVLPINVLLAEC